MSTLNTTIRGWAGQEIVSNRSARRGVGVAAFVAAMALSAYVVMPLPWTPVPMTLQPLIVLLAGLLLGPTLGATAMAAYLALGISGAPVFAAGGAGLPWLLGPTGGYLIAFPAVAYVVGRLAGGQGASLLRMAGAMVVGLAVLYLGGVSQLMILTGQDLPGLLALGVLPFLGGDLVKIGIALVVAGRTRDRSLRRL